MTDRWPWITAIAALVVGALALGGIVWYAHVVAFPAERAYCDARVAGSVRVALSNHGQWACRAPDGVLFQ
jgi:hypothetical protein